MAPVVLVALASLGILAAGARAAAPPPAFWTVPPAGTPNQGWPDGPICGNGNIGLSIGGKAGELTAYLTTHGFWSTSSGNRSSMPPMELDGVEASKLGFPGCPADNCTITVGLTIGMVTVSSPDLEGFGDAPGSWSAALHLSNGTAVVTLAGANGTQLTLTAWVSATTQLAFISVVNSGAVPLRQLNITSYSNNNVLNVPVTAGCSNGTSMQPSQDCPAAGQQPPGQFVRKDANPLDASPVLPITGALALRPMPLFLPSGDGATDGSIILSSSSAIGALPPVVSTAPLYTRVPTAYWANGKDVDTYNIGTSTVVGPVQPGGGLTLAVSVAASRDTLVYPRDPQTVVQGWLAELTADNGPDGIATLWSNHSSWWASFWEQSGVSLDPSMSATEGYYYSALYALGSGSRAGQLVMDLWSPFRTTDYPLWRSNPTMDYNQQALYSGVYATNHVELAQPYYDFLNAQLAGGEPYRESEALGCPGGVHLSVDLSNWGLKMGVANTPQDWGILSNSAYAATPLLYQFYSTPLDTTFVDNYAWPYLTGVGKFWTCYLQKMTVPGAPDGYQYWDVNDCTGDEGCSLPSSERTNPMWGVVYITRVFRGLVDIANATGRAIDPAWTDVLAHLPPIPTTLYQPSRSAPSVPVLAWYGQSTYTHMSGQSNNLHAIWPGELLSMSEPNATLLQAAVNSFNFTAWSQSNSFNWVYSSAARVGVPPATFLARWNAQLAQNSKTNRLLAYGGMCSDSLGAVQFVVDMLVQGQEGFLRLFPAWPANASASFTSLRMRGAFLVSASYNPPAELQGHADGGALVAGRVGGVQLLTIKSEAGGPLTVLSPWPAAGHGGVRVTDLTLGGTAVPITWMDMPGPHGGPAFSWNTAQGHTYAVAGPAAAAVAQL